MNIFKIKTHILSIAAMFSIISTSCNDSNEGPVFTVKGCISEADGKSIYISKAEINGITLLDSAKLDKNGEFEFKIAQPESFDFYWLEMDGKTIIFSIDSTETVTINSTVADFDKTYTVEGSPESGYIKEMNELQLALEEQVNTMLKSTSPAVMKTRDEIYTLIGEFKENITRQYIASAPGKASAYYALTLSLNGEPLFNPMVNRNDSKCFAAVATNMQYRFPNAKRTKQITEIATQGMKATRPLNTDSIAVKEENAIKTTGLFDIRLPKANGDSISLSSLEGKVVLLDFTNYENPQMSGHNIRLRELYDKYQKSGLEIFQVSFDLRENFWQMSASNLPWICVRDGQSTNSPNILYYNIQQLPTFYLINKDSEIVLRDSQISDLEKEIEKLLAE